MKLWDNNITVHVNVWVYIYEKIIDLGNIIIYGLEHAHV